MFTLQKTAGEEFRILNFSDTHMKKSELAEGHLFRTIFERTVSEAVARVRPHLITVSGDISWSGDDAAHAWLADYFDSFGIPWAPVMGNHDNQCGAETIQKYVDEYKTYKNFVYEEGPKNLGNGNFVIAVEEDGKILHGIIMLDTHDRVCEKNDKGEDVWAPIPDQY